MFKGLLLFIVLVLVGGGGWLLGSVYPAPQAVLAQLTPALMEARLAEVRATALAAAAAAGDMITVEKVTAEEALETPELAMALEAGAAGASAAVSLGPASAQAQPSGALLASGFETALALCPGMRVSNAPAADPETRAVTPFAPLVEVNGITLAVNPTRGACLSSGFGPRGSRLHKGLDYHAGGGGPILAGADGVVLERRYRDDFGNMLLIDHGGGVYTRYAHLSSFAAGVVEGARVALGQQIGLMGNTAAYPLPIHLHYEVLLGDYANPRGSFGLEARDPFSFPAAE